MAIIKCKMCGGDIELAPDMTFGTCEYCGSKVTLPKVDDEQRAAAFNRGNHFRRIGEFDKALTVYESLVRDNEADAEAHWCSALCRFGIEYVKDPASGEYIPTCHRASFDSFLEDVDTRAAIQYADAVAKRQYEHDAQVIEEVRRGILTLSQNEKPYDVFICYKETDDSGRRTIDSQRAQEIYYQLTDQGRRVFFARITLEDKAGQQYEPYIFAALNSAKVMIVVGTKREHLEAVWVKNEWSRFLALMKHDRKKLLIPCYAGMDPYDMPEQLSVLQSYDMTKIGFIQDLTRGISKVLDADKKPVQSYAPAQEQSAASSNVSALLKRGYMALEDGDWAKADDFFEQVLNHDAECAEAYMGKVLTAHHVPSLNAFIQSHEEKHSAESIEKEVFSIDIDEGPVEAAVERYEVPGYFNSYEIRHLYAFDGSYTSTVKYWTAAKQQEEAQWQSDRQLTRACQYAKGAYKQELASAYQGLMRFYEKNIEEAAAQLDRDKKAREQEYIEFIKSCDKKAAEQHDEMCERREAIYEEACSKQAIAVQNSDAQKLEDLAKQFETIGSYSGYKDTAQRKESCLKASEEILEKRRQEELDRRKAEEDKRKRRTLIKVCVALVVVIVIIVGVIVGMSITKSNHYKEAEDLYAAGNYDEAGKIFEQLGKFKDAENLLMDIKAIKYDQAEELLSQGKTKEAAIAFGRASGYEDAAERSHDLWSDFVVPLAAADDCVFGLKSDGSVVSAGNTSNMGTTATWMDIVSLSAGHDHVVGLKADGTVIAAGYGGDERCNVSGWSDIVAVAAGGSHTIGLKADGTVVATGDNKDGKCNVSDWSDIVAVAAGGSHTVGLKSNGTVVAVGNNAYGQCDVSDWRNIVAVSAGNFHTVGLKSDGTVVAVGNNEDGRCNVSGWYNVIAVSAGSTFTACINAYNRVEVVGDNDLRFSDWRDIVAIDGYSWNTVGLKSDGTCERTIVYKGDPIAGWADIWVPKKS